MKAAREKRETELLARPHKGAVLKLAKECLAARPELLEAGAEAYCFWGVVWTCVRIATLIGWEFRVSYYSVHVLSLMKELHWMSGVAQPGNRLSCGVRA
jgi:hypothetical protein